MSQDFKSMPDLALLSLALKSVEDLQSHEYPIDSIKRQLQYLINLESGKDVDRSRLKEIVIGTLVATYLDGDDELPTMLYEIAARVRRMRGE